MTATDWQPLQAHWLRLQDTSLNALFDQQPDRFDQFSLRLKDLLLDFSKEKVTEETIDLLVDLAQRKKVEDKRDAMLSGARINVTENRAVLHTALRRGKDEALMLDGTDVMPGVRDVLDRMAAFCDGVRSGAIKTYSGKAFTDVVNIGIGGSDLGPAMAVQALAPFCDGPRSHFVSNVDPAHIADTLSGLDPDTTMIIVASKTFTTLETLQNAGVARDWLGMDRVADQCAAVSAAPDKAGAWGIREERVFGFEDWVGGRYSLWSAIGLPIMMAIGPKEFRCMLKGARAMDEHFASAPIRENLPMMLGLIGAWRRSVCDMQSRAILPYDQRLARLPAYLQQLDMESNGKSVKADGSPADVMTGPAVWGEPGTNGQHAFYQLLHQGKTVIPCEFIMAAEGHETDMRGQHELLLANCLAQSQALMTGRSQAEVEDILSASGMAEDEIAALAPHKVFSGDRPSTTILYKKLTPYAFGRLIALYEHRVFVEAALWDINAFDQWGVELGKELAKNLGPAVSNPGTEIDTDSSTLGLINAIHDLSDMTIKSC